MSVKEIYRGVIHGSTIQLKQSPDIPDGMEVDVVIRWPEMESSDERSGRYQYLLCLH